MTRILWAVTVILLVVWGLGLIFRVAGSFIHILLLCALVVLVYNLLARRTGV
jgi:predicted membrane metal-binding protein